MTTPSAVITSYRHLPTLVPDLSVREVLSSLNIHYCADPASGYIFLHTECKKREGFHGKHLCLNSCQSVKGT